RRRTYRLRRCSSRRVDQRYAREDKRNAQELSHVQRQVTLERNLVFLDEFDHEAGKKAGRERNAEDSARKLNNPRSPVGHVQRAKDHQVRSRFIKHCWMTWEIIHSSKNDRPWQVRRPADNFGIEEIADADHRSRGQAGDGQTIRKLDESHLTMVS